MKTLKTNYFNQFVAQSFSRTKYVRVYSLLNSSDNKFSKKNKHSINFVFVNQAMTKKEVENILD